MPTNSIELTLPLCEGTFDGATEETVARLTLSIPEGQEVPLTPLGGTAGKDGLKLNQWELRAKCSVGLEFVIGDKIIAGTFRLVEVAIDLADLSEEPVSPRRMSLQRGIIVLRFEDLPENWPTLVPFADKTLGLIVQPTGLHALVELPERFYPRTAHNGEGARALVLRLPQFETIDKAELPDKDWCWSVTNNRHLPALSQWTASELITAFAQDLRPEDPRSPVDSIVPADRAGAEPLIRFGYKMHQGEAGKSEIRWKASSLGLKIVIAAKNTDGYQTPEAVFEPEFLTGAFKQNGKLHSPIQFQTRPDDVKMLWAARPASKSKIRIKATLSNGDKRKVDFIFEETNSPTHLVPHAGPIHTHSQTASHGQELRLCTSDGWLGVRSNKLLHSIDDNTNVSGGFTGDIELPEFVRTLRGKAPGSESLGCLQVGAIERSGEKKIRTRVSLTPVQMNKAEVVLYFYDPWLRYSTPPFFERPVSGPAIADEGNDDLEIGVDVAVPGTPPTLTRGSLKSTFGRCLFVSTNSIPENAIEDNTGRVKYGVDAGLMMVLETGQETLTLNVGLAGDTVVTSWVMPPNLPLASRYSHEVSTDSLLLDDRRGLFPLKLKGNELSLNWTTPEAEEEGENSTPTAGQLPAVEPVPWRDSGLTAGISDEWKPMELPVAEYFLTTLAGVEMFWDGDQTRLTWQYRHANPALDDGYASVPLIGQDQESTKQIHPLATVVRNALAFTEQEQEQELKGVLPNATTQLTVSPSFQGLDPKLALNFGDIESKLERPTKESPWAESLHLSGDAQWTDNGDATVSIVGEDEGEVSFVGGGQPLIADLVPGNNPAIVLDGAGEYFEQPVNGIAKYGKDRKQVRVTRSVKLGQSDVGTAMTLELCGVTLGEFDKQDTAAMSREHWQLHDGEGRPPHLRGFPFQPTRLKELSEDKIVVRGTWLPNLDSTSDASILLTFSGGNLLETKALFPELRINGKIDWSLGVSNGFDSEARAVRLTRMHADVDALATHKPLAFVKPTLTFSLPCGMVEVPGECRSVSAAKAAPPEWYFALRADHKADHKAEHEGLTETNHIEHTVEWFFIKEPGAESTSEAPRLFAYEFLWRGKHDQTTWELVQGATPEYTLTAATGSPFDLARLFSHGGKSLDPAIRIRSGLKKLEQLVSKVCNGFVAPLDLLLENYVEEEGFTRPVGKSRREQAGRELHNAINRFIAEGSGEDVGWAETDFENARLKQWKQYRNAIDAEYTPMEWRWFRRTWLEALFATAYLVEGDDKKLAPPKPWQDVWHTRILRPIRPEEGSQELSVIGDVRVRLVRHSARRLAFEVTKDVFIPERDRELLGTHFRVSSLGGLLAAEITRTNSQTDNGDYHSLFLTNVALQMQLLIADRQNRDAIGVWRTKPISTANDSALTIREDEIGDALATVSFPRAGEELKMESIWARAGNPSYEFASWFSRSNQIKGWASVPNEDRHPNANPSGRARLGTTACPTLMKPLEQKAERVIAVVDDEGAIWKLGLLANKADLLGSVMEHELTHNHFATSVDWGETDLAWVNGGKCILLRNSDSQSKGEPGGHHWKAESGFGPIVGEVNAIDFTEDRQLLMAEAVAGEIFISRRSTVNGNENIGASQFHRFKINAKGKISALTVMNGDPHIDGEGITVLATTDSGHASLLFFNKLTTEESPALEGQPLVVSAKPPEVLIADTTIKFDGKEYPELLQIDELVTTGKTVCAIRSGARVFLVKLQNGTSPSVEEIDAGDVAVKEIQRAPRTTDADRKGDLLIRGPASRTQLTGTLSYSSAQKTGPSLSLTGKLVLQNDVRFLETIMEEGFERKRECTHRMDLFLDRANVPVDLLVSGPRDQDWSIAGVANHVFRFSNGTERHWQAPQLVRLTTVGRSAKLLGLTDSERDRFRESLVVDASGVFWVQPEPNKTASTCGGGQIHGREVNLRLLPRTRSHFDLKEAVRLRVPFIASTAFERFGLRDRVKRPQIVIPAASVGAGSDETFNKVVGTQWSHIQPRVITLLARKQFGANPVDGYESVSFHRRSVEAQWLSSQFLHYCLSPEDAGRHTVAPPFGEIPRTNSFDVNATAGGFGQPAVLWPGFADGNWPDEIPEIGQLRQDRFQPKEAQPGRPKLSGNRTELRAATLAIKDSNDGVLSGPVFFEFPYRVRAETDSLTAGSLASGLVAVDTSDTDIAVGETRLVVSTEALTEVESGSGATFTVNLQTEPDAKVVVNIVGSSEVAVDKAEIAFSADNWKMPQPVTVTAIDDDLIDGKIESTVEISVDNDQTGDQNFKDARQSITITAVDNEPAAIDLQLVAYADGEIVKLAEETVRPDPDTPISQLAKLWGRHKLRVLERRDEAFVIRDFRTVIPLPPAAEVGIQELLAASRHDPPTPTPTPVPTPPADVPHLVDPRMMSTDHGRLVADPSLGTFAFFAAPVDHDGKAAPVSATRFRFAGAKDNKARCLPIAEKLQGPFMRGYVSNDIIPFEMGERGYPELRSAHPFVSYSKPQTADATPAEAPTADATPVEATAVASFHDATAPPIWERVSWSARPGEETVTVNRVEGRSGENGLEFELAGESETCLRRPRAAAVTGSYCTLARGDNKLSGTPWSHSFVEVDLTLEQRLTSTQPPSDKPSLVLVTDRSVHTSIPNSAPAIVANNPRELERVKLFVFDANVAQINEPSENSVWVVRNKPENATAPDDPAKHRETLKVLEPGKQLHLGTIIEWLSMTSKAPDETGVTIKDGKELQLTLTKWSKDADQEATWKRTDVASVKLILVKDDARLEPLKSSVAILTSVSGDAVNLVGYDQLSPERFSAIEPRRINDTTYEWIRRAQLTVRHRAVGEDTSYEAIVTGPSGETYPFVKTTDTEA